MAPTPTLPLGLLRLIARQQPTATIVVGSDTGGSSSNSGLDGGAIAGIVIGSVVGILLLLWIIRVCTLPRAPDAGRLGWYDDTAPRSRSRSRSRSAHGRHHHRHHHHHSGRRHGRRRSSTPHPVVVEEKVGYVVPRRPSATYYPPAEKR